MLRHYTDLSTNHQLGSHFFRFLGVHCEHLENSIKHLWVEQAPCKMNIFCLTGHSHQKWPTNLCCMIERPRAFDFCFKASVCELLGDEYSINWLLSARMAPIRYSDGHHNLSSFPHLVNLLPASLACPPPAHPPQLMGAM